MMTCFIITLSFFNPSSPGEGIPFQRPAEIVGLHPFALQAVYS